jgi:hypothetical protein
MALSNKENLKKLLAPIIKECVKEILMDKDLIQEVVLSSGVLSTVVKEVAVGLNESRQPMFANHMTNTAPPAAVVESRRRRKEHREEASKLPTYEKKVRKPKSSTEFEKIQENVDRDYSTGKRNKYGALAGSNPQDEGVDLSSLGMGFTPQTKTHSPQSLGGVDLSELNIGRRLK